MSGTPDDLILRDWARLAGERRRQALQQRHGRADDAARESLFAAIFDKTIETTWKKLGDTIKGAVRDFNDAGQFRDLRCTVNDDAMLVERRHHPAIQLRITLDRTHHAFVVTWLDQEQDRPESEVDLDFGPGDQTIVIRGTYETVVLELLRPIFEP